MPLTPVSLDDGLEWASQGPTFLGRAWLWLNRRARFSPVPMAPLTAGKVAGAFFHIATLLALASAPYWKDFFEGKPITGEKAVAYVGAMFVFLSARFLYERFIKLAPRAKRLEGHRKATALEHVNLNDELLALLPPPAVNLQSAAFMSVVRRTLALIHAKCKEGLDSVDQSYLEVSLLLFQQSDELEVVERAVRTRACGARVVQASTMAFFTARSGQFWKHVPDLKSDRTFSLTGISTPECPYRSIMFAPIYYFDGQTTCCGVVTIDSSRAYEFWNEKVTKELYYEILPYVRQLAVLLQGHATRIVCL